MKPMPMHYAIRLVAGTFILASLALGHWVNPLWYLFTAFVGVNLIQSAFTRWCQMEKILAGLGLVPVERPGRAPGRGPLPGRDDADTIHQR
jgi:Inner membrane protein YgaP-like, transmembrane domain